MSANRRQGNHNSYRHRRHTRGIVLEISSSKHYSSKFQSHKARTERQTLKLNSRNMEIYNTSFCLDELLDALSNSNDSAVGPDDIHYQMLKHLPSEVLHTLLSILNDIWLTGNFPSSWRQSYVVPIAKQELLRR